MTRQRGIAGLLWPPLTAVASAPLPAMLEQFALLERATPDTIRAGQQQQLAVLNTWLAQHCALHRQRLQAAGISNRQPLTLDTLARLPPMTRRHLQAAGDALFCGLVPASHQPVTETRTSGSSGEPVVVRRTMVTHLYWLACTMREHLWWQRGLKGTLAIVRANLPQPRISQDSWGPPANLLGPTGPAYAFSMALDTATLAAELETIAPKHLLIYPTALKDLLRHFRQHGGGLASLVQIRTIGETLNDDLRDATRRMFGVDIVDSYSSQEVGVIAIQCPASGLYHLMAENLIVEVLNAQGRSCIPGEAGEVVVTDLHNFATPLVRYAIGDHAEMGGACPCGRNLPTLRRILGRSRNMAIYPDGSRRWPRVGFDRYREIAPVIQYQLIQKSLTHIELRLVVERPLHAHEEQALTRVVQGALGHPFQIDFQYFPGQIPKSRGGKFEEFVCEIEG